MDKKIRATFIVEMLGRPKEHLEEALEKHIGEIEKLNGVKIIEKKIHEPKKVEQENKDDEKIKVIQELFTSFAEIEAEFDDINGLFIIAFNFMPSHFEITSPKELVLKNNDLSGIITAILLKMHKYDEIVKTIMNEREILFSKIKEIQEKKKDEE